MGQSIFMANIFRGGSLSSLTHINVTKWTQVFFKLIFPHTFSFAPHGYVLTKKRNYLRESVSAMCSFICFEANSLSSRSILSCTCNWK